ncbi:hypothetical protein M569_14028 [Genlisea aurea]|uniref:Glycine-rich protein n=1 Tax=Genlisea aurea TaxID=192259 RepID=S8C1Y2_9LAMI|nr:hypothetical protein M569_14028 [Genlisea aurea]
MASKIVLFALAAFLFVSSRADEPSNSIDAFEQGEKKAMSEGALKDNAQQYGFPYGGGRLPDFGRYNGGFSGRYGFHGKFPAGGGYPGGGYPGGGVPYGGGYPGGYPGGGVPYGGGYPGGYPGGAGGFPGAGFGGGFPGGGFPGGFGGGYRSGGEPQNEPQN